MAWVVARGGGGYGSLLASLGMRVALIHGSPCCVEKWDSKWKSMAYGYMDVDACRKRHRKYMKRQRRAAGKRDLLQWRSVEMHADEYREAQERRKQKAESTQKPHTTSSGYSRRFENEWRAFERKYQARYEYRAKQESYTRRERAADEDPTAGATGQTEDRWNDESESARYRRQFWSNTWRGFEGDANWNFGANPSWESPYQGRDSNNTIGSPADRLVLGLSPVGPLSLEELKIAFRQCALSWHPDRHDGHLKQEAEAKFKRVGDAYRTLRGLF